MDHKNVPACQEWWPTFGAVLTGHNKSKDKEKIINTFTNCNQMKINVGHVIVLKVVPNVLVYSESISLPSLP